MLTQGELDLLHGWLNGTTPDADRPRLQSLLRESAEARRMLRALGTVDAKLQECAAANPATLRLMAMPGAQSSPSTSRSLFRGPFRWRALAAAVAVHFALAGAWLWQARERGGGAQIAEVRGAVEIVRGGKALASGEGMRLRPGDEVRTGADASAQVTWDGGTTWMRLGAATALRVATAAAGKDLFLQGGALEAQVARQPPGRPLIVRTDQGRIEVLGTRFTVSAAEKKMSVSVTSGRVLLAPVNQSAGSVIEAFHTGAVAAGGKIAVARLPAAKTAEAGLLAHWPLSEGKESHARDASGNARHAKISNPDWIRDAGFAALAFSLEGVLSADKRSVLSTPALNLPTAFTIALRVRCDTRSPRSQVVFTNAPITEKASGFSLLINYNEPGAPALTSADEQALYFRAGDGERNSHVTSSPRVLATGRWHLLVVRVDQAAGRVDLLVDGRAVLTQSPITREFNRDGPLWFGAARNAAGNATQPLAGSLRDIRIYERLLDADDIAHLARQ